jgi:uncharacterized protein YfkK (UPF0435 family)
MEDVSIDEMWKIIERYGINRKMMEMHHTNQEEIQALYQIIKKKESIEKNQT